MTTNHIGTAILRTIDLNGPAGRLEALLNAGHEDAPFCVLICHPHPLGGGTFHNKVVFQTMKAFQTFGLPVLRFNFRGTGRSEGVHDDGRGEIEDVRTALDWLDAEFERPILFAGFSFGAAVGMEACCGDSRVRGMVGLGLPVKAEGRNYHYDFLANCAQPKLFISGTNDQYGPRSRLEEVIAHVHPPSQTIWVEGADHFFLGKLDQVQTAIRDWLVANFALRTSTQGSGMSIR
jgi:alpha/beta superfamily hydrolase